MLKLEDTYLHKGKRKALVAELRKKGIQNESVLEAINTLPRHFFFDTALISHAYEDKAFPIGEGQTISQPYTVAFQSSLLEVIPGDKILEIGTGSGYQASILHLLGAEVISIEYQKKLFEHTSRFLQRLGIQLQLFYGDGTGGVPAHAPYDKIIVTAGAPVVPEALIQQLKIGGILVIPIGDRSKQAMVKITKKSATEIQREEFDGFAFVPLLGKEGWNH
ncbi:MAG: protein-L-isoaspartate(D-aspartate) O-methyltransferase [Algoriphagus sp.]|jgi:protein-L-isoaspartate(D-aspartate) O-methyltransferase|uniref:protein-L-isoaspartate(D-aspartate) O-methyltransferase n=1 Tax=Algoriphagus sp. TaxID=1872435 RepID=UPI00275E89C6|nr:protein-L-isoaspartate(D-aspartate) O-methyltransferase [Algoriphagus sp.]MDP4746959.1 protein-L-isoaspartate(D-aspartate) O-methyltransferase [Algoriphagus sp.]MDP4838441.1 protein-L-isoaspartate(D-aspartate) O-methyltransferase [Algoriphagus sp.]MDP4903287.1 protein-L-isoaspartate(D-aspartate) O-methyltransferase [Algoriphagus sp.]MDP4958256.1 protein-L-isoaspartate(D-aspartate) O-methyltransferase [Algoriphagus sp.]